MTRTLRPQKRSVSPFGFIPAEEDPFGSLRAAFKEVFPPSVGAPIPSELRSFDDASFVPALIEKLFDAPANDAPQLDALCQFLLRFRGLFEEKALADFVDVAMQKLFERKTELFMIDQQDQARVVLFSKERDALVGRYFAPLTESHPGDFSAFVNGWMESENPDRVLHFLDFCAGSKNPTFEHHLLFTHPALHRVVSNKSHLRSLFEKTSGLVSRSHLSVTYSSWEEDVKKALGI